MNIATFLEPMELKMPSASPFISFISEDLSRCGNQSFLLSPPPILNQLSAIPLLMTVNTTAVLSVI